MGNSPSQLTAVIVGLIRQCEGWIEANLTSFDPRQQGSFEKVRARLKAFDELCLYAMVARHVMPNLTLSERVGAFISSVVTSEDYIRRATSEIERVLLFAFPAAYAARYVPGEAISQTVAATLLSGVYRSKERLPHRILDGVFSAWLISGHFDQGVAEAAWRVSNGRFRPIASASSADDYYAFTHNVFFMQKLNLFEPGPLFGQETPEQADDINLAIARFVFEDNLDLAAELALSQLLLGSPASGSTVVLLGRLLEEISAHGHIGGLELHKASSPFEDAEYAWHCGYHPSLVAMIFLRYAVDRSYLAALTQASLAGTISEFETAGRMMSCLVNGASSDAQQAGAHLVGVSSSFLPSIERAVRASLVRSGDRTVAESQVADHHL